MRYMKYSIIKDGVKQNLIEIKRIRMKLENEEKNYLNELLGNQINLINPDLEQNNLDEDKIKKMINEGYSEL